MTLPNATLFPQALLPLYIFEPRYRQMLADALHSTRMFAVAMRRPGSSRETPLPVAGVGLIRVSVRHKDGTSHLILQGLARVELEEAVRYKPYRLSSAFVRCRRLRATAWRRTRCWPRCASCSVNGSPWDCHFRSRANKPGQAARQRSHGLPRFDFEPGTSGRLGFLCDGADRRLRTPGDSRGRGC